MAPPIPASLVFDRQDDANTYDKDFEFVLWRQILMAPVMEKTEKGNVYLPKDKWIHYWSGKRYDGGQSVTVDAPLYGRDGTIIPTMPDMRYIYEKAPNPITLDIYPAAGEASEYVMYDCETPKVSNKAEYDAAAQGSFLTAVCY